MITIKNSQLNKDTIDILNKIIDLDVDIDAEVAFKLGRIIMEISAIVDNKNQMEQIIISKYADKDEYGNIIQAKDESGNFIPGGINIKDMDSFSKEMFELMNITHEIEYDKINFEDLKLKTAKVKDTMRIDFLFN